VAGIPAFGFVAELSPPVSYAGPVVGAWMAAGLVVLVVPAHRHPGRLARTGRVHLIDPDENHEETGALRG
jgi:hypothetical protein